MNILKKAKLSALAIMSYACVQLPALAQQSTLSADSIVSEITASKAIVVAVAVAIFGVLGVIVAYRMSRKITG